MATYRNRRTSEEYTAEPGSWMNDRLGRLVEVWDVITPDPVPEPTPDAAPIPAPAPAAEADPDPEAVVELVDVERPARSATKSVWRAYAVARGMSEAEAEEHTRDQLADLYTEQQQED